MPTVQRRARSPLRRQSTGLSGEALRGLVKLSRILVPGCIERTGKLRFEGKEKRSEEAVLYD